MNQAECPCKRVKCERHGKCDECKAHHSAESRKTLTYCQKLERKGEKRAERQRKWEQKREDKLKRLEQKKADKYKECDNDESIVKAGIEKKSFELYYNGGSIWCEHLDSMGTYTEKVKEKFLDDFKNFNRPSMTSFVIINLDETMIDNDIISCITDTIVQSQKRYMKIAFVGVQKAEQAALRKIQYQKGCIVSFFDDYEKAKQWVLP